MNASKAGNTVGAYKRRVGTQDIIRKGVVLGMSTKEAVRNGYNAFWARRPMAERPNCSNVFLEKACF